MDKKLLSESLRAALKGSQLFRLGSKSAREIDILSAYDVMRAVGVGTGHKQRLDKYKAACLEHGVTVAEVCAKWQDGHMTELVCSGQSVPMMDYEAAQRMVCYLLRRNRKSQDELNQILESFGIPKSQYETALISQPEKDTISSIQRAIPFESLPEFRLGEYRIDLYFPSVNICVECDENNHAKYDQMKEIARYNFIRKHLRCEVIRYDPYASNFNVSDVIRKIFEMILLQFSKKENAGNDCKENAQDADRS